MAIVGHTHLSTCEIYQGSQVSVGGALTKNWAESQIPRSVICRLRPAQESRLDAGPEGTREC